MNDDIVTRLREGCIAFHDCDRCRNEAADEIELLREWKEFAYQTRNKYWWAMRAKTLKKFDEMHKADWARHDD